VFYSVDTHVVGSTISFVLNDCCCHHPDVLAACSHGRRSDADQGGSRFGDREHLTGIDQVGILDLVLFASNT
jgi:hypothetical protein